MYKVAIDAGALTGGHAIRGVGTYTRELIKAIGEAKPNNIEIEAVDFKKADLAKYDLVHYPYFDLFYHSLPIQKLTKTIVTVHDVIPLLYPYRYPPGVQGTLNFNLQKLSLKNTNAIITDTETSKKDIVRYLGIKTEKIAVTHLAPGTVFKPTIDSKLLGLDNTLIEKYHLPENFILYVGDVNYNKNVLGLVRACKIAKLTLIIVGKQAVGRDFNKDHIENQPLKTLLDKYGNDKSIIRLGFVPEEDLVKIYNLASVYCQPSFYEGFGLPVLEAMACGTPVVVARTQSLVEIAENAALFTDPKNPSDIALKLKQILNSSSNRVKYKKLGLIQAKKYSWEKTAKLTIDVYQKVLAGN